MRFVSLMMIIIGVIGFGCMLTCGSTESTEDSDSIGTESVEQEANQQKDVDVDKASPPMKIVIGNFVMRPSQRMVQDSGIDAIVADQAIGVLGFAFQAQRDQAQNQTDTPPGMGQPAPIDLPNMRALIQLTGTFVTETVETFSYVPNPDGGKPQEGETNTEQYTYFLANDSYQSCEPISSKQEGEVITVELDGSCLPHDLEQVTVKFVDMYGEILAGPLTTTLKANQMNVLSVSSPSELDSSDARLVITNVPSWSGASVDLRGTDLPPISILVYQMWPFDM
jgi:hypothetical protein